MKILLVFLTDARLLGRKLPLLAGGLLVCAAAFFFSLPPELARSGDMPKISIAMVNNDSDDMAQMLAGMVSGLEMVDKLLIVDEQEAEALLDAGDVDVCVTMPAGMIDALIFSGRAEITLKARDPFTGPVSLDVASAYVKTMNRVQQTALSFYDSIQPFYGDRQSLYRAERVFNLSLLQEAISRARNVSVIPAVAPYHLQLLALLLFLTAALAAITAATLSARQFASGYFRRLAARRVRAVHICAAKALLALSMALVFSLALTPLLAGWDIPCSAPRLFLSASFLTLIMLFICMAFAAFRRAESSADAAAARAALGAFTLLLFMLFAGGGFYPVYLMDASFRTFNPAWLAHLLAEWTLGGQAPFLPSLLYFAAPAAAGAFVTGIGWREA
ncbi:MAG: ABC transporter permease [Gracilibacteraceae bacterium]|nr:ABC transporter permease [Gracilibacteraceae bacterium]